MAVGNSAGFTLGGLKAIFPDHGLGYGQQHNEEAQCGRMPQLIGLREGSLIFDLTILLRASSHIGWVPGCRGHLKLVSSALSLYSAPACFCFGLCVTTKPHPCALVIVGQVSSCSWPS